MIRIEHLSKYHQDNKYVDDITEARQNCDENERVVNCIKKLNLRNFKLQADEQRHVILLKQRRQLSPSYLHRINRVKSDCLISPTGPSVIPPSPVESSI